MNHNSQFVADLLRQGSRALAGYASRELLENHPEAAKGFEPDPFAGWQDWLAGRLEELAAAVTVHRPQLFIAQTHWGKAILQSRGILPASFRNGLECLRAVLASELPAQARPLALEYVDEALEAFDEPPAQGSAQLLPDTEMGRLASTYLVTLLEGDQPRAAGLILDAFDHGHDVAELYLQVLLPAQKELGRMWMANEINIAEEHFVSQTTRTMMAQLLPRAQLRPSNGKTVLAAAVAGNQHDIGLQAVADFFEMDGWRTVLLGANVPARDLVEAVDCFGADLVGLSVSQTTQLGTVKMTIQALRDRAQRADVKILLGGSVLTDVDDLPSELGADGYAADPTSAVALGRRLVGLD